MAWATVKPTSKDNHCAACAPQRLESTATLILLSTKFEGFWRGPWFLTTHLLLLAASFITILLGSECFTNGVEWMGERLNLAEAAVGSLLAAVGTALPETFVPLVAFLAGGPGQSGHYAVGTGAIVGAPLMLSTLALLVMAVASLAYRRRRGGHLGLQVAHDHARSDLRFFLSIFLIALAAGLWPLPAYARYALAIALLGTYAFYCHHLFRLERAEEAEVEHGLYLEHLLAGKADNPRFLLIVLQVSLGVALIIVGAREFVEQILKVSEHFGLHPGLVSLLLSPLATELPEKYNSVIWIRQSKDHLALANITGAMVFQACIPVALGMAATAWHLSPDETLAVVITLISSALLYLNLRRATLKIPALLIGGAAYFAFLIGAAALLQF